MKQITFTHIHIENFCNHKEFDADFPMKAIVSGYNKQGKTSILNAILFVLTGKLQNGSDAGDSIRPHDKDGKRIDNTIVRVDLTTDIDGTEYILTKMQKQKFVTKRGSSEAEFQGNENLYEISGIPKKAKDFENFLAENICPVDELPFCENANAFLMLDNKKRRIKVLGMAKQFTDDDVIATNPEFEELRADLKVGTVEEIMKRCKQTHSTLKKTLEELPVRIDEASKQIVDFDFSALELEKKSLNEKLTQLAKAETDKVELDKQILNARFELSAIENKLTSDDNAKQNEIKLAIAELKNDLRKVSDYIVSLENEKEKAQVLIQNNERAISEAEKQKELASTKAFDDTSLVCPTCGQNYPEDKEKEIRNRFEQNRQDEMNRLVDYIESLKAGMQTASEKVEKIEGLIKTNKQLKADTEAKIQAKENESTNIVLVDPTKDKAYRAKQDEIATLESNAEKYVFGDMKAEINAKIKEVERQLAQAAVNAKLEERIEQLEAEKKVVAQNILKQERLLFLLEEYNKAKIAMLEDSVNQYFDIVRFRFWKPLINGGMEECLYVEVDGTSFDGLLNKSDRLLAQVDLCKGFCKAAGVWMPQIIDDTESIDSDRLPDYEGQQIFFRRDDCELSIKEFRG